MSTRLIKHISQAVALFSFVFVALAALGLGRVGFQFDVSLTDAVDSGWAALRSLRRLDLSARVQSHSYEVQVFSQDPLILYIRDFLSGDEINHIVNLAEDKYEVSRLWPDEIGYVDENVRVSESAIIDRTDVVRRVQRRARRIMGWRNNSTHIQPMAVQRYRFNGFYTFHYDWDGGSKVGNRMTTFMVYLTDKCSGGGTNFPRVEPPKDKRWCDIIECDSGDDGYPGVTFKPIAGSAIFWENFHPNGTAHEGTRHAGLPVASGEKVSLNIWSWDSSWRPQVSSEEA